MPAKLQERFEALGRTRGEIVGEMAASLGRTARVVEGHLATLRRLRAEIDCLSDDARSGRLEIYAEVRREAQRYLWYLRVQREVIGFTDDRTLDEAYPIPGPLRH